MARRIEYHEGFSTSLWVSLAVKSVRLGWPAGLEQCERVIGKWKTQNTAKVQIFEDIWPSVQDLPDVLGAIYRCDWDTLCTYDTHHGRGLTEWIASIQEGGYDKTTPDISVLRELAETQYRVHSLPPRADCDFWTWHNEIDKLLTGPTPRRVADDHPWTGMPPAVADMHTIEGRQNKTFRTVLSGDYPGHKWLAKEVASKGWSGVRDMIHSEPVLVSKGAVIRTGSKNLLQTTLMVGWS